MKSKNRIRKSLTKKFEIVAMKHLGGSRYEVSIDTGAPQPVKRYIRAMPAKKLKGLREGAEVLSVQLDQTGKKLAVKIFGACKKAFYRGDLATFERCTKCLVALSKIPRLAKSFQVARGNVSRAAEYLEMTRNGLYFVMEEVGLTRNALLNHDATTAFLFWGSRKLYKLATDIGIEPG